MNKNSILHKTLARALSMMRPHNSEGTKRLTDWLEDSARTLPNAMIGRDAIGNLHVDTRLNSSNRTLFVAHVDTVHRKEGPNKIRKTATHWHADGAALGADDGAGVAMLMHLIHAGIPAYYIFTQGEECGGIGASWLADNWKDGLAKFDRAIAFDRRGIDSVITHQGRGRCCSDVFGQALADALNEDMTLMYLPDNTGVYTDTAEFIDIIPSAQTYRWGITLSTLTASALTLATSLRLPSALLASTGTAYQLTATRPRLRHGLHRTGGCGGLVGGGRPVSALLLGGMVGIPTITCMTTATRNGSERSCVTQSMTLWLAPNSGSLSFCASRCTLKTLRWPSTSSTGASWTRRP